MSDENDPPFLRRPVDGVLDQVADAEREAAGLHNNQHVLYAGLVCPIVCEEATRVQIMHGNTTFWLDKDKAVRVRGSGEGRDPYRRWDSLYRNPLLKPHRP